MTLSTYFVIRKGTAAREVFEFCQDLLTETDEKHRTREQQISAPIDTDKWEWRRNPGWSNQLGQGLPAILEVEHGPDGPLLQVCDCDEDYKCSGCRTPDAFIRVNWDTAYGYSGPGGIGCTELHAYFIRMLGQWCDQRGLPWSWQNEYTGEWHKGATGLEEFGAGGEDAMAWFRGSVVPVMRSLGAQL